ncbi:MAG: hypothetical protein ACKVP4_09400 [Hyphomicrobium sp.]
MSRLGRGVVASLALGAIAIGAPCAVAKSTPPANNPKATIWDDSIKPVDPNENPKTLDDENAATAIRYAKPPKPEQK